MTPMQRLQYVIMHLVLVAAGAGLIVAVFRGSEAAGLFALALVWGAIWLHRMDKRR